jgi:CRP/FNR family transcriptional regulator, anaerobic regulatory protein
VRSVPRAGTTQGATIVHLHGAAHRVAINSAFVRMHHALAQIDDLKRALASSQQESAAAQEQVETLAKANAHLRRLALQGDVRTARHLAWDLTDPSLANGLELDEMLHIERLLTKRIRFRKNEALYRVGDAFAALYLIRAGSCKTVLLARDGEDQVAGYHMSGEVLGIEGIDSCVHGCQAIALEEMEVCRLPFGQIEDFARSSDQFRYNLYRLLSHECSRVQALILVLGTMRAERRLAIFLLDLSQRYRARGFSSCEFVLRMTREDIGSYLGLKLETVSRQFSRLQREGLIQVQGRVVKLLDRVALSRLIDCGV